MNIEACVGQMEFIGKCLKSLYQNENIELQDFIINNQKLEGIRLFDLDFLKDIKENDSIKISFTIKCNEIFPKINYHPKEAKISKESKLRCWTMREYLNHGTVIDISYYWAEQNLKKIVGFLLNICGSFIKYGFWYDNNFYFKVLNDYMVLDLSGIHFIENFSFHIQNGFKSSFPMASNDIHEWNDSFYKPWIYQLSIGNNSTTLFPKQTTA